MLVHLKNEDFDSLIKEGIVVVDFYAEWCGPCKMLAPILDDISNEYKVIKINVDEHQELAMKFGIMSIPTVIIYKEGIEKQKVVGFIPKNDLLDKIKNA